MATRDMTKAQFNTALKRNGFAHEFMGWYADTTGRVSGVKFWAVYNLKPFKLNRRATLAKLINDRERTEAEQSMQRRA